MKSGFKSRKVRFGVCSKYQHYSEITDKEAQYAMVDQHLIETQLTHDVAYAGALAGYKTGIHDVCGQRILVTSGPRLLIPKDGSWALLKDFLGVMLGEQCRTFFGWIKSALRRFTLARPFALGRCSLLPGRPAAANRSCKISSRKFSAGVSPSHTAT